MHSITLSGGVGYCNAVRRVLMSDLTMWAPCQLRIRTNTSCQTDEYLAHRIGLIPFQRVGNGNEIILRASGPGIVTSSQFIGPAFESVHTNIEIMLLDVDQELDLTVVFDEQSASKHARYSPCAAVGMKHVDGTDTYRLTFETLTNERTADVMTRALDKLEERVDNALHALATQPAVPPRTMC